MLNEVNSLRIPLSKTKFITEVVNEIFEKELIFYIIYVSGYRIEKKKAKSVCQLNFERIFLALIE